MPAMMDKPGARFFQRSFLSSFLKLLDLGYIIMKLFTTHPTTKNCADLHISLL